MFIRIHDKDDIPHTVNENCIMDILPQAVVLTNGKVIYITEDTYENLLYWLEENNKLYR